MCDDIQVKMIDRLIDQREVISHILSSSSLDVVSLSGQQWTTISLLSSTLRPLLDISTELTDSLYACMSVVIPLVGELRRTLTESGEVVDSLRDVLIDVVDDSFADIFDNDELCAATVVGTTTVIILLLFSYFDTVCNAVVTCYLKLFQPLEDF